MYISHQWSLISTRAELFLYFSQIMSFFNTRSCDAYVFATRLDHAYRLLHRSHGVHGVDGGHTLNSNGIMPAHRNIANPYFTGQPTLVSGMQVAVKLIIHNSFSPILSVPCHSECAIYWCHAGSKRTHNIPACKIVPVC